MKVTDKSSYPETGAYNAKLISNKEPKLPLQIILLSKFKTAKSLSNIQADASSNFLQRLYWILLRYFREVQLTSLAQNSRGRLQMIESVFTKPNL